METKNRLKDLRQANNFSQKDFFENIVETKLKLGVTLRTYQNWEKPENEIKSKPAQALADFFGVSVGYLMGYEDHKDPVLNGISSIDEILNEYKAKLNVDGAIDLKLYDEITDKLFSNMGRIAFSLKSSQEISKVENHIFNQAISEIKQSAPDILKQDNANFLLNQHGFSAIEQFYKAINGLPTEERELIVSYVTLPREDKELILKLTTSLSESKSKLFNLKTHKKTQP